MIIGLDVGGTHTDVVLMGDKEIERQIKVLTDHNDLFSTVLKGLEKITEGIEHEKIDRVVLSTTLTTNTIVQKQLTPVGMIVTGGPGIDPEYYRTGEHYHVVEGAMDHRGRETEPINPRQIRDILKRFRKTGIRTVGVVGKFSVRNPAHEQAIADMVKETADKVFMGHRISGKLNFSRRLATTFLNASVYPAHKKFFEAVKKSLEAKGFNMPIHVLKADGGTMSLAASLEFPGQTILSGPAASVMGAIASGSDNGEDLVLDIGGTTTDMAILINRVPVLNPLGIQLGEHKTLIRALETRSVGIGGDSQVRLENGRIRIGPERLGPALAYGGPSLTPTDALVVLGKIPDVDASAAAKGLQPVADALGKSITDTAQMIFDRTCAEIMEHARTMIDEINAKPVYTVHELLEDFTVKPKKILVLGGPAYLFAKNLEKHAGIPVMAVPRYSVANAIGAALARTTCEVTLFVDTEQRRAAAPEEGFSQSVPHDFSHEKAMEIAHELLKKKALSRGADAKDLAVEVLEDLEFNMVRGFYTTGKNMRIKLQVKPGLIHEYDPLRQNN